MKIDNILNIKNSKIRIFPFQTQDVWFIMMHDLYSSYLLSLMIDKLGFDLQQFSKTYVYAFWNFFDYIKEKVIYFEDEYFIINLENYYHSSEYSYNFLIKLLDFLKNIEKKHKIIIHTIKTVDEDIDFLISNYDDILLIINTDIEYFFNELFFNNTDISNIPNISFRDDLWNIHKNISTNIEYNLWDYILWWYHNLYYQNFPKSKDEIISIRLKDKKSYYNDSIEYCWTNNKYVNVLRNFLQKTVMLTTGRWCRYNCNYCYRWVKYKKVRQIPLNIIKKDLDHLSELWYDSIYFYDDCFISTNLDRLDELLDILKQYDFSYQISSRYETLTLDNIEKLSSINISRIQIWLQSISIETNINMKRSLNLDEFKKRIIYMKSKWINISLDLILWLPTETLKDFIETLNFAILLKPSSIFINTLFLNPKTELYKNKDQYWIKTVSDITWNKLNFHVSKIYSSNTFSIQDLDKAKEYILKVIEKIRDIYIVLR